MPDEPTSHDRVDRAALRRILEAERRAAAPSASAPAPDPTDPTPADPTDSRWYDVELQAEIGALDAAERRGSNDS